jgi:hypothetical protein
MCKLPDHDVFELICGYPLPCPWHDKATWLDELFADCREGNHGECLFQWPNPLLTCDCPCHKESWDAGYIRRAKEKDEKERNDESEGQQP